MRQIFATHRPSLTSFILGLTRGHRQTTEDLFQETMLRAWRHLDAVPTDEEASRRWLYTVARRVAIDDFRKRRTRPIEVDLPDAEGVATIDVTAVAALANHTLREAATNLSRAHREVLYEVFIENRPLPDVAARLGIPLGTVRSRIHYALRSIRETVIN